jgi:hypothetical protein
MKTIKATSIITITFFMTLLLVGCDRALTATMTTETIHETLHLFVKNDITLESEFPVFDQTIVEYTINNIAVTDLKTYERPLFDQYQTMKATIYGSDQTKTYTYQLYVLSNYSPKHQYVLELNGLNLDSMTREEFQQGFATVRQQETLLLTESMEVNVRHRGNSSWANHEKKPFRIEFNQSIEMMGLDAHDTFYLISMHADKALMRDVLAHQLASLLGIERTNQTRYVELYINGLYHGLYMLIEDRTYTDVDPSANDIQFSLELDYRAEWESYNNAVWFYANGTPYVFKRPNDPSNETVSQVKSYIESLQNMLSNGIVDRTQIDIHNWVTYFFIQEYFKNVDAWGLSTFLYKEANAPLMFGPVWDFDLSVGNADYVDDTYSKHYGYWFITHFLAIWPNLALNVEEIQEAFHDVIIDFYVNEFQTWLMMIDTLGVSLIPYAERNFERWPVLNEYVWPNPNELITSTYYEQVQFVKNFLEDRLIWMVEDIYQ